MLIIEGNIVNIDGVKRGRIEIGDNGLILSVGQETGNADVLLTDELIFPGFVDIHVHARECADHSWDYKEDFKTVGEAAINGGVVAIADMPNNPVPPVDEKSYTDKLRLIQKSEAEVLLYAGIGPHTSPLHKAVPYKIFMGPSIGDLFFSSLADVETAIAKYRGQSVSFHCEDPKILQTEKAQPTHEQRRPAQAEVSAVVFALELIKKYNLQGKICHCSTKQGLEKIAAAKHAGVNVTVEVSPHHLYYDQLQVTSENHFQMQMNPPLRSAEDKQYLIEALRQGEIDYLATDHAPHTLEEKLQGTSGTPQLDTYGAFVSWLMAEKGFRPSDILRVCCTNPAKFYNQFSTAQYGKIEPGFVGSLTMLDANRPTKIQKSLLKTKCGWSPFEGVTFHGSITYTIIKGKLYKHAA